MSTRQQLLKVPAVRKVVRGYSFTHIYDPATMTNIIRRSDGGEFRLTDEQVEQQAAEFIFNDKPCPEPNNEAAVSHLVQFAREVIDMSWHGGATNDPDWEEQMDGQGSE